MNDDTDDQRQQAWLEHQQRQHGQDMQQGMQQECVSDDGVIDGVNGDGDDAQFDVFTGAPLNSAAWLVLLSDCSETNSFRSVYDSAWASLLLQDQGVFVAHGIPYSVVAWYCLGCSCVPSHSPHSPLHPPINICLRCMEIGTV